MEQQTDILILGAGLTGLTTAFYTNKNQKDFLVIDKNPRVGGVINTEQENGFTFETGPNTGVLGNPEVAELFEDLNGACEMVQASGLVNKRYILKGGKWQAMPMGLWSGIRTPLFTWKDKFRILGEPFRAKGTDPNEVLAETVKRRMGKSFLQYGIDPFILGVYAGDPSKLVTKYAFSKLYRLEQDFGSFIGGSMKKAKQNKHDLRSKKATRKVFSVKGGLAKLPNALYEAIGKDKVILNAQSLKISVIEGKYHASYLINGQENTIVANKLVSTLGAHALAQALPFIASDQLNKIQSLKYAKVLQAVLGFDEWDGRPLDGFGGLIPFSEKRDILGAMFLSTLFPDRAPEGGALVSVFVGGIRREDIFEKSDKEIKKIVEREITDLLQIKDFNPILFKLIRYQHAIPQYGIESEERLQAIAQIESQYKGLIIGGNLKDGIGMADRIKQATELAVKACN